LLMYYEENEVSLEPTFTLCCATIWQFQLFTTIRQGRINNPAYFIERSMLGIIPIQKFKTYP
jgi:hypothetical protein